MLENATHPLSRSRSERWLHWLLWVIEQMLNQFVPGGETLAIYCVHPLHWRLENPEDKVSIKALVSDLARCAHLLLQISYPYRGVITFHSWLSKGVSYVEDHETRSNPCHNLRAGR